MSARRPLLLVWLCASFTLPAWVATFAGLQLTPPVASLVSGVAILSASFLLLWACEAAQADISQALALAVVAFIAVLPEYAVDSYFTWMAGKHPGGDYAHFAIANMTGANRLIVGVAWVVVALLFWWKTRRAITLEHEYLTEIGFLAAASAYALVIVWKGSLAWYDGVILLSIYARYVVVAARRPCGEVEAHGPSAVLVAMPTARRRAVTILMFVFAAGVIIANAERFAEGLVGTGALLGINRFLLVQWLAPIASEAPEFIVAIMFALRADATQSLGSLLSSKLNQWTLLVGMIPITFAVAHGTVEHSIPMNGSQMQEILLTAAQSLLAVVMLSTLRLTVTQALLLFGLFFGQLVAPGIVDGFFGGRVFGVPSGSLHTLFALLYFVAAAAMAVDRPYRMVNLVKRENAPEPGLLPCANAPDCPRWSRPDLKEVCPVMVAPERWPEAPCPAGSRFAAD